MRDEVKLFGLLALIAAAAFIPAPAAAQTVKNLDPGRAVRILGDYCAACHGWAENYASIMESGRIVPGDPDSSDIVRAVENGVMPPSGSPPDDEEKAVLRAWVAAGAPNPAGGVDATSAATPSWYARLAWPTRRLASRSRSP